MNYRITKILPEKTLTGAGTETITINIKDIISRLTIAWRISKSAHGMNSYPYKDITKIELVDGSDVLFSMDGGECQALCIYDRKCPTMNHGQALSASSQYSTYGIDFGRYLHDPELAFDPTKFNNPQLKVSYDVDVSDTGNATGYLEVWADCFDEKLISPIGFLMSKEHWSGAKPTSGYEYIALPTDYPIRKMLIKAYVAGAEPWYQVDKARIDEDHEKRIPFDWDDLEDYYRVMKGVWTPVEELLVGVCATGGGYVFYVTPTDYYLKQAFNVIGDGYVQLTNYGQGGKITPIASAGSPFFMGVVSGYLPNHCFEFPFGNPMDMDDWYDVTKLGSCRLRIEAGSGGATDTGIVLQQLRRY